ncbi:hypothetical protein J6590_037442 [Homalodisca vitripennis]|nr:hypothetical protein J6590_037442 [Homalodisca vitripennis]
MVGFATSWTDPIGLLWMMGEVVVMVVGGEGVILVRKKRNGKHDTDVTMGALIRIAISRVHTAARDGVQAALLCQHRYVIIYIEVSQLDGWRKRWITNFCVIWQQLCTDPLKSTNFFLSSRSTNTSSASLSIPDSGVILHSTVDPGEATIEDTMCQSRTEEWLRSGTIVVRTGGGARVDEASQQRHESYNEIQRAIWRNLCIVIYILSASHRVLITERKYYFSARLKLYGNSHSS